MHPFRKLLLISMGRESSFEKDPSPEMWAHLFKMAKQQALLGVLNAGVHRLPATQLPPAQLLEEWDRLAGKIAKIHARHERQVAELEALFERKGLRGCVLKGTGLARLYPDPSRRQCGDIDVWVPGPRKAVIEAFSDEFDVHDVIYQECKVDIFDDTVVEVHFHPTKVHNPFCNARLQRWLDKHSPLSSTSYIPAVLSASNSEVVLCYPDAEFNAIFCLAHMYKHYILGGLGLRQMMDYYYVLRELPASKRKTAMKALKRLGMGRFAAATMLALQYNFGVEDEYLLCKPDHKRGPKLINDMIMMGNFGILNPRLKSKGNEGPIVRFHRKNLRALSNIRFYPREVIWTPFARLGQYFWRLCHGYL